ncbi:hypothetical protein DEJ50_15195 [Streptomyces venezuelae]|uniref:Uncharacterized protein n=1 Tax=Streptomyces venezuelae TaxID=54571 RepID=A0A5P2D4L0_STRVZ|nr:hypothetical protein [Streptomyces venezuelae]QES48958.1 hypothetical protein DEJ50_15195 [Streptomyces venezuelae]
MSTPENPYGQHHPQDPQDPHQPGHQPPQPPLPQDPYATQTWQTDTWDTTYQPSLGAVPGQAQPLAAPDSWFREEPAAAPAGPDPVAQPSWAEPQPLAAEQAYHPYAQQYPGDAPVQPGPAGGWEPAPVAPEGWFRDEAPAPAQLPQQAVPGAAETAYLPPYPGPADAGETAYLPPYPGPGAEPAGHAAPIGHAPGHAAPAAPADPAETAYLPPYPAYDTPEPVAEHAAAPVAAPGAESAPEPAAGAAVAEAYSTPTLAGSTRIRDPRQARAEGRSPIIDPGPQAALVTVALGALLAGAAAIADLALLVPLIALQALTAAGWFRLNGMWPARQGIALAFAGAVAADLAVLAVEEAYRPGAIIGTLGAWVLLTLVLQLRSRAEPDERMYGLMASVASAALAIVCAGYLAADSAAVTVGAAAVAVAVFTRALPLPAAPSVGVSLAAAAGAGIAVGGMTTIGAGGALVGLAAGVCALIGLRVAAYDYPSKFVHMTAGVALPLAVAAPAIYLMGRVVN